MPKLELGQDLIEVTDEQMATFAAVDRFLSPLGVKLVCLKCDTPFHGTNSDMNPTLSVACLCRELRTKNKNPRKLYSV